MRLKWLALLLIGLLGSNLVFAQGELPPAEIANDEGGPVVVTGTLTYTDVLFTAGVAQPVIILEDQGGFVERNEGFLMPPESQVLGQLTSDFYSSPVSYSLALPEVPQGTQHDVDEDGEDEVGVQIFAVAYWTNIFGDPYLEERDLFGGGWSNAYASTRASQDLATDREIIGGKFVVYSPDGEQGFPSSFGEDGFLFTGDDESMVLLPQGYTVVDMDTDPFTFDRSREPVIDLIEPQRAALDDFSGLSYTEAFDAMIEKFRNEYAFTELKGIDWDEMSAEFRPRFEHAEADGDVEAYLFAMRDFTWAIPDGHVATYPGGEALDLDFVTNTAGGLGMAIGDVDDGSTLVYFLTPGGPAEQAGIELGAEILEINGVPTDDAVDATVPYSSPFSTDTNRRLQQLRYVLRAPMGTDFDITYQNPGGEPETVTLSPIEERDSFAVSSFNRGLSGIELPVEYELLDSGYGYVKIYSFFDNNLLTVQLWERMIQTFSGAQIPGIIIDMRQNGGGSGFLADQMAAYFFDEPLVIGNAAIYDEATGDFYQDPNTPSRFYLPPENLRYGGEVAVLVGPSCASACEFFSYDMTIEDRAAIVGQYPTGGLGGSIQDFAMPEGQFVRIAVGRNLDLDGNIIIEGTGVVPTVPVPVTLDSLISGEDVVLAAAVSHLNSILGAPSDELVVQEAGDLAVGDTVTGDIGVGERVRYSLVADQDMTVSISLGDDAGALDTYLRVYDADENLLAENDDIELGVEINSFIEALELSGGETVIVEVGTYADGSGGTYTLSVMDASTDK